MKGVRNFLVINLGENFDERKRGGAELLQAEGILRFPLEEKQFVFSYKKVVIMKKTLAAVAVLGAFAGSALAADVTLYGKIDMGLQYQNTKADSVTELLPGGEYVQDTIKEDSLGLNSGLNSSSRFGIKGSEQISEGLTVGFQLENGFSGDDGKFSQDDDQIFGRESRLYVQTDFGTLHMGRMGGLDSGCGSLDIFGGYAGVFGTGWGSIGDDTTIFRGMSSRLDNVVAYQSPTFGGVTLYAQASLKNDSDNAGEEGSSKTDRYYAIGATGSWGALSGALVFSTTDYQREWVNGAPGENKGEVKNQHRDDMSKVVSGYVAYDFGVVKTTLGAQYFDDVKGYDLGNVEFKYDDGVSDYADIAAKLTQKGYGVMLGASAPLGAGELFASIGYTDFEASIDSSVATVEGDGYQFGIGYQYPLSKRTYLYTAAGYTKISHDYQMKGAEKLSLDDETTEVVAGIVHSF